MYIAWILVCYVYVLCIYDDLYVPLSLSLSLFLSVSLSNMHVHNPIRVCIAIHYKNMPIQIYWKFYHQKIKIFR